MRGLPPSRGVRAPTSSGAMRVTSEASPVVSGTAAIRPSVATVLRTTSWAMSWVDAMPPSELVVGDDEHDQRQ